MNELEQHKVDVAAFNSSMVGMEYPHFELSTLHNTLPLVVKALEPGDTQLIVIHNGVMKCVAHISMSAYNVEKILRVYEELTFAKSSMEYLTIRTPADYIRSVV